jgi:hypothetical protein
MKKFIGAMLLAAVLLSPSVGSLHAQTFSPEQESQIQVIVQQIYELKIQLILAQIAELQAKINDLTTLEATLTAQQDIVGTTASSTATSTTPNLGGFSNQADLDALAEFERNWPEDRANHYLPNTCKNDAEWHADRIRMMFCVKRGLPTE